MTDIYKVPAGDAPQECHAPDEHGLGCTCLVGPVDPFTEQADAETGHDPVANPSHYAGGRFPQECRRWTDLMSFDAGNAFKYVWRHADKGKPVEDLSKSVQYLDFLLETRGSILAGHVIGTVREAAAYDLLTMLESSNATGIYTALYAIFTGKCRMAKLLIRAEIGALQAGSPL